MKGTRPNVVLDLKRSRVRAIWVLDPEWQHKADGEEWRNRQWPWYPDKRRRGRGSVCNTSDDERVSG